MTKGTVRASFASVPDTALTLRRELGRWDLTAIGINQVIGSGVFVLPSLVAAQFGSWGPLALLATGFASLLVALCFAELSSRFEGTGGPYLYTRAAFGRFVGFEVGWMQWFTRVTGYASVVNALVLALGFYWPGMTTGLGRASTITCVVLALGWINLRGIRLSAFVINLLTIVKLVPLTVFIVGGVWFIDASRLTPTGPLSPTQLYTGALLLIFAFGGYDIIGVPAGEATNPRRHLPFAYIATIVAVTGIIVLVQLVAMASLPDLAAASTPLADASLLFMGTAGALLISTGSIVSMLGNNVGQVLAGSRILFALAENGDLPRSFGAIHPRYRTPAVAVIVTTVVSLSLALWGSFAMLAIASAVARLITYLGACAATVRLRHRRFRETVRPATFVIPMGRLVPILAIGVSLVVLTSASRQQLLASAAALSVGVVSFLANVRSARGGRSLQSDARPGLPGAHIGAGGDPV